MLDSEQICEVVRVNEILPHGNADKLELAHFSLATGPTAYTCVVMKGEYQVGDLAAYVGVDSVVPLTGDESDRWHFLTKRPDGSGKDRFRIKAARLRGVYSEGILTSAPAGSSLGDQLADKWKIGYHNPTIKGGMSPAIVSTKSISRLAELLPTYGVTSLRKAPWMFKDGEEVLLTEKIHGCNFRAGRVRVGLLQRFIVGSHHTVKTDARSFWRRAWDWVRGKKHTPGSWYGEDIWSKAAERYDLERKMKAAGYRDIVIYGELYGLTNTGGKIQDLVYGGEVLGLRLFDVFDVKAQDWLPWAEVCEVADKLRVGVVPVMGAIKFDLELVQILAEGNSTMPRADDQIREGLVVRTPWDSRRGKWVSEAYRMRANQD